MLRKLLRDKKRLAGSGHAYSSPVWGKRRVKVRDSLHVLFALYVIFDLRLMLIPQEPAVVFVNLSSGWKCQIYKAYELALNSPQYVV